MPTTKKKRKSKRPPRVSRTHPPEGAGIEGIAEWQVALRRQCGREQSFSLENSGAEPIFSEFEVSNPGSGSVWRVAIRGDSPGQNFCACPDFATNELGTCKHIEFTLGRLERKRGGKAALAKGFRPGYSEVWLEYGARRRVRFRAGRNCPPALRSQARRCFSEADGWSLPRKQFAAFAQFAGAAGRSRHEVRIYDDAREFIDVALGTQARQRRLRALFPEGEKSAALRELLALPLYPYQAEGALFAVRAGRALIADEMGLGKTIQAIAAAEILLRHLGAKRVLVVCPASLKAQWQHELRRLAHREALVVGGTRKARMAQFAQPASYLITNYDTLKQDAALIEAWSPDLVIADEAQRIKNWDTVAARSLKKISSPYAFVLTGTPLENRLQELLSIVQFVDKHRLGPTWRFVNEHQSYDETGRVTGYQRLDRIGATLEPIMIRRRKAQVLSQLPPRMDKRIMVELTPEQRDMHEEHALIVARLVASWRRKRFLTDGEQKRLMAALQCMRMVCDSTYLLDAKTDKGNKIPELMQILGELLQPPDAKAVIFSQWVGSQRLLSKALERAGIGHLIFNGSVPTAKRGELIKRFREDSTCRVFLSTDAGGVGLNLQHAAIVINLDLPWNPAVLEQRIGRVFRLGQQRAVQVVNLVAASSIEQGMLSLLAFKQSLFSGALDGGESTVRLEGTRLSRFMQQVEKVAVVQDAANQGFKPLRASTPQEELSAPPSSTKPAQRVSSATASGQPVSGANPWQPLLEVGLEVLSQLANPSESDADAPAFAVRVERDADSGQSYVRLPVPEPETVRQLASALGRLLGSRSAN
ncbi:MAG: DEAD/DEAH box helicase [Gammaproteobacteria bacterium]